MRRLTMMIGLILLALPMASFAQSTPEEVAKEAARQIEQARLERLKAQQEVEQEIREQEEKLKQQREAIAELQAQSLYDNGLFAQYAVGPQVTVTPFGAIKTKTDLTVALDTGLPGTWWREPRWAKELNLTPDQQKRMDEAFRQNRIKLIDLTAALDKAELMLEPLVENVNPGDQAKILAQIDRVADARAELEKANARMLLAIREVLTQEQWSKLPSSKFGKNLRLYKIGAQ